MCFAVLIPRSLNHLSSSEARIADCTKIIQSNQSAPALKSDAYYMRGNEFIGDKKYDEAIADENSAIGLLPNHAGAFAVRGNAYLSKGNFNQAIADVKKALSLNPKLGMAFQTRGRILLQLKRYDAAIDDFNHAIQIDPSDYQSYVKRGLAYFSKQQVDRAITDYDRAIALNSDSTDAFYCRGLAYGFLGNSVLAIRDFTHVIHLDPRNAAAFYFRGLTYYFASHDAQAISDFDEALKINPDYEDAKAAKQKAERGVQAGPRNRTANAEPSLLARAGRLSYICKGQTIVIDLRRRMVTQIEQAGPLACRETFVNGATGPLTTRDACNLPGVGYRPEDIVLQQSVEIAPIWAEWGGVVIGPPLYKILFQNRRFDTRLNLVTGEYAGMGNAGPSQCRLAIR